MHKCICKPSCLFRRHRKRIHKIDAFLDEEAWQNAIPVDDFLRYIPDQGGPAPGSTSVRMLQDDQHLYIGVIVSGVDYDLQARSRQEKRSMMTIKLVYI